MSAIVRVKDIHGNFIKARALLDTCSTAHFVTEKLSQLLGIPTRACSIPVGAIDGMSTLSKEQVEIIFQSLSGGFLRKLSFLIIPRIADFVPDEPFPRDAINIPPNLCLADPQFHVPRSVDLLIGAGATLSLMSVGQINLSRGNYDLVLQKTRLGWIVAGGINVERKNEQIASCHLAELTTQIEKFWIVEDFNTKIDKMSDEELCETHYIQNTRREVSGRYVVRLPFRTSNKELGNSRVRALKRFYVLEARLNANPELKAEYYKVMEEYLSLGHMSLLEIENSDGYYLPHHAVIKTTSNTTKVRAVFDASAKTDRNISLNEVLLVGPTIQDKLFDHLLRFRVYACAITADIAKMYRQVLIHPDDRKYQRVFWRHEGHVRVFELNTVTFGVSAAPFLAIRTLRQLAKDEAAAFPRASEILKRDFYVDDLLTGADSVEEAVKLRDEIIELLNRGGFIIRQWASNHEKVTNNIDERIIDFDFAVERDTIAKTLGIVWNSRLDQFSYEVSSDLTTKVTKRRILSEISKIFDPLGLLGPVLLRAKIIMQKCWLTKIDWDESLPQKLLTDWITFASQLGVLRTLTVNRRLLINSPVHVELHGFCDASQDGYGACVYVRSGDANDHVEVHIACAKSRVKPLKTMTIPKLELCGALILARLLKGVITAFNVSTTIITRVVGWSDSTIVLQWLQKSPQTLKVFEGNRVAEIQSLGETFEWRHVRSHENPADALSRGQSPADFLNNNVWFSGPEWLKEREGTWPTGAGETVTKLPGLRNDICLVTKNSECYIWKRFSSYQLLINTIAYCLRVRSSSKRKYISKTVSIEERREAEQRVLWLVQQERFSEEFKRMSVARGSQTGEMNVPYRKSTRFDGLNPFIDNCELIRVGGRLKNAKLSFDGRFPILLPSNHHVTDLIIRDAHHTTYHAGIQTTLYTIRTKFWILNGKDQVRREVRRCIECIRQRPNVMQSKMADLPRARVNEAPAFMHVGTDFFGPIYIKEKKLRNRVRIKAYGCVFVCMVTKAVHIEIASDLTTDGFLGAFRRFTSRRGIPEHVYSDNGTNFVGANNQLRELYALFNSEQFHEEITRHATSKNITWHFNPPLSPHFGGLWEATVKSFKHHFKRVVKNQLLTFEVLNTLAIEIEAILNSRPLCSISTDPNDPIAITPAHLLAGRPFTMLPEHNYTFIPDNRLSVWQFITKARQDFWKRWSLEYLNELQVRQKWKASKGEIAVDDVVILIERNQPCARWPLGVIIGVHPGSDGITRVVTVKTVNGIFKRNISQLCRLPIEESSIQRNCE